MATTFNSVDPRTGETGPRLRGGHARRRARPPSPPRPMCTGPARSRDSAKRAALLRGAAARLRAAGDEIVADRDGRDRPARGAPARRARAHRGPARGVRRRASTPATTSRRSSTRPTPAPSRSRAPTCAGCSCRSGPSRSSAPPTSRSRSRPPAATPRRALAAGVPVIVKGHPSHPGTSELVARELAAAVADAGLPEGTFAPPARGVAGGRAGARRRAGDRRRRLHGLLRAAGARSPTAPPRGPSRSPSTRRWARSTRSWSRRRRWPRAPDAIAEGLTASVANFGGQLCTKPGVVFVPDGEPGDAFAADVAERLDGTEPTVLLNERLRDALREAVGRLEQRAERLAAPRSADGPGFRHQPSAYAPTRAICGATPSCSRSTSARSCCSLRYGSRDDLLAALSRIEGQLTGSLHAQPRRRTSAPSSTRYGRARRARDLRRLPDRRRGHLRHAPRRAVPGHDRARRTRPSA